MFFKNLQVFRLGKLQMNADQLNAALKTQQFNAHNSHEIESIGWTTPVESNSSLAHDLSGQILLALKISKKILPSSTVNAELKRRSQEQADQQGFALGRKATKDLKERVIDELLPRAFNRETHVRVWLDTKNGWLGIDSASPTTADLVLKMLLKCDKFPVENLRVNLSPTTAMTDWLIANEAPKGFTIDQDAELRAHTEDKATVRYVRQTLEAEDTQRHIAAGKQCTKLALTWDDKISFVLGDSFAIKRIKPLDILDEGKDTRPTNRDERFDSDFTLMAAELALLLDDLVFALGGELDAQVAR